MTHEFAKAHKRSASNICNNNLVRASYLQQFYIYFIALLVKDHFYFYLLKLGICQYIYILTYTEVKKLGSDSSFAFKKINLT